MTSHDDIAALCKASREAAAALTGRALNPKRLIDEAIKLRAARCQVIDLRLPATMRLKSAAQDGEKALLLAASGRLDADTRAAVARNLLRIELGTSPGPDLQAAVAAIFRAR